jgi:glycosyltransferase involved in cell wall biosynthesis
MLENELISKQKQKLIVACLPAYNEDLTLPSIIIKTQKYVDQIFVYDDGSRDMTSEVASALNVHVISNDMNHGKGFAMKRLFEQAFELSPDVTITLDSDGQHDPNEIPRLIAPILDGEADIVLGSRYVDGAWTDMPLYRRLGLKVVNILNGSNHAEFKDTQNGFRAFSRKALEAMLQCESNGYVIESEQLEIAKQLNLKVKEVPVSVRYNGLAKTSKKNPLGHGMELMSYVVNLMVQKKPLWLLGVPGFCFIFAGLFSGVYLLWDFNITRLFSIPVALLTFGTFLVGVFLVMTALILYGISNLKK